MGMRNLNLNVWAAAFLSALLLGCLVSEDREQKEGVAVKQGTVYGVDGLRVGVASVSSDSAVLSVLSESGESEFRLGVGEEAVADGCKIRNLGTYVDPLPSLVPGSSNSNVRLKVDCAGTG